MPDQFTPFWKWRVAKEGKPNNGLADGADGPREISKLELASGTFKLSIYASTGLFTNEMSR